VAVSAIGLGPRGLVETAIAFRVGSVGLPADALHLLTDVSSSPVVFVGFRQSKRPATPGSPYGYKRADDIVRLGVALASWASAVCAGFIGEVKWAAGRRAPTSRKAKGQEPSGRVKCPTP
jgi:divalent metal cation (Fe/Co/Zn/Cd) transporter